MRHLQEKGKVKQTNVFIDNKLHSSAFHVLEQTGKLTPHLSSIIYAYFNPKTHDIPFESILKIIQLSNSTCDIPVDISESYSYYVYIKSISKEYLLVGGVN